MAVWKDITETEIDKLREKLLLLSEEDKGFKMKERKKRQLK